MGWESELVDKLRSARHGQRGAVIDAYRTLTGKSAQALWRIAKLTGYTAPRKTRSDSGECVLTDAQIEFIAGLMQTSKREIKGVIMPVETALSIAEDNGIIEKNCISVPRLQQILRERHLSAAALDAPEPHTQMRSEHPNHVHLFDVSVCIQYYLKSGRGLRIMDERQFYRNKPDNFGKVKQRILRYLMVDHFSGAVYLKYYQASGETQLNLFDFICSAWGNKPDDRYPFRGVPFNILMDAGAANTAGATREFLENLDVKFPAEKEGKDGKKRTAPHNPRRQGAVEVMQNIVEMKFESRLRFEPVETITDLNRKAFDWCVWFNGNAVHTRHGMTRTQCWLMIKNEQLRELPETELLQDVYSCPKDDRLVSASYSISFRGQDYDVRHIPMLLPGKTRLTVCLKPFLYPELVILHNGIEYQVKPIGTVAGGFRADAAVIGIDYKSKPESRTQQGIKKIENMAYGEQKKKDQIPFEGIRVFDIHADKVQHTFMPRAGVLLTMPSRADLSEKQVPIMDLMMRLKQFISPLPPELNQTLRGKYGTSLPLPEVNRLVTAAQSGNLIEALEERADDLAQTGTD